MKKIILVIMMLVAMILFAGCQQTKYSSNVIMRYPEQKLEEKFIEETKIEEIILHETVISEIVIH